jgi:uncharacterized membrane protein YdjX (TVP38/TMEM64 family)/rhodanese-related sulfurtransferase
MKKTDWLRVALALILAVAIGLALYFRDWFHVAAIEVWVKEAGPLAPLLFIALYALAAVLLLPGTVFTLAGGILFGPVMGTVWNLTGATLGALLAFLTSRHLASRWVARRSGRRLAKLMRGVEAEGWRFVAFVRLVPLFPYNLVNYALGLTRIPFIQYALATLFGMLPACIAYTYLGYAGREALAGGEGLVHKLMLALALLAVAAFLPRLISRWRLGAGVDVDELQRRLGRGDDLLVLDVRSAQEYCGEFGHIEQSVNIPLDSLRERMAELENFQEKTVAVVCRTDVRSVKAAQWLAQNGFAHVHVVHRGMTAWAERGYAVEHRTV